MAPASTPPRRGRPPRLDRRKIIEAAMAGDDVNTLTVRELAARLGVSHGALYGWVKNQDEIFDLVCDVMIERVLPSSGPDAQGLRPWLVQVAYSMRTEFLAVPGFASRLARPHRHSTRAFAPFRAAVISAFSATGLSQDLAEQNWYIFIVPLVSWLASEEAPLALGDQPPRFELFLDALLAGLPVRAPSV